MPPLATLLRPRAFTCGCVCPALGSCSWHLLCAAMAALHSRVLHNRLESLRSAAVCDGRRRRPHDHLQPSVSSSYTTAVPSHSAEQRLRTKQHRQSQVVSAAPTDIADALESFDPCVHTGGSNGGSNSSSNGAAHTADADAPWSPEAFQLEPGALSTVNRQADADESLAAFRCDGCTRTECQVSSARLPITLNSISLYFAVHSLMIHTHTVTNSAIASAIGMCLRDRGLAGAQQLIGSSPLQATCARSCSPMSMTSRSVLT